MRVVLDTNIYISALMYGGLPGTVLELALLRSFTTIISPALLDELDEKLQTKFEVSGTDAAAIRSRIIGIADVVLPRLMLSVVEDDPDDNRVLECAVEGQADYVVTGDSHLLKLGQFRGTSILRTRQFLDTLEF